MNKMKKNEQKNNKIFRKGLTLIELIIVIAIIGIMTAVTYVSLRNLKPTKKAEVSAREIGALLRQVQNDAVSGKMIGGTTACRFVLYLANNGSNLNYSGRYVFGQDAAACNANGQTQYMSGSVSGVNVDSTKTISYFVPHGDVTGGGKILLTTTDGSSRQYTVCVNSRGNVEERFGNAACP